VRDSQAGCVHHWRELREDYSLLDLINMWKLRKLSIMLKKIDEEISHQSEIIPFPAVTAPQKSMKTIHFHKIHTLPITPSNENSLFKSDPFISVFILTRKLTE
jgi:hypothetical protein